MQRVRYLPAGLPGGGHPAAGRPGGHRPPGVLRLPGLRTGLPQRGDPAPGAGAGTRLPGPAGGRSPRGWESGSSRPGAPNTPARVRHPGGAAEIAGHAVPGARRADRTPCTLPGSRKGPPPRKLRAGAGTRASPRAVKAFQAAPGSPPGRPEQRAAEKRTLVLCTSRKEMKTMPQGDRTGPSGSGPRSGRGRGYCSGNEAPGFSSASPGRGRGWRAGYGGGESRRRRGFFSRGRPGWREDGPATRDAHLETLKDEASWLERTLENLRRQIHDLESRDS